MEIKVDEDLGLRIDLFLSEEISDLSRNSIKNLIKSGNILVNGKKAKPSLAVVKGDLITVNIPEEEEEEPLKPENIPLDILYEDEDLLVVNKSKNMVVYPATGHEGGTLVNALLYHCNGQLSTVGGTFRPGIVHRIDKNTTGSLVVCKNDRAHEFLSKQFQEHSIKRRYLALACGYVDEEGTVDAPIGRDSNNRMKMSTDVVSGRRAVTHYRLIKYLDNLSYIECRLETGRTHQIRTHMASIGHPLLGDSLYGGKSTKYTDSQCLHAWKIGFIHPSTKEYMEFEAPLPQYFSRILKDFC